MNELVRFLIICALFCVRAQINADNVIEMSSVVKLPKAVSSVSMDEVDTATELLESGRGLADSYQIHDKYTDYVDDAHAAFKKRAKPLKHIFMGIYKNYKSTYLGNKTTAEYKKWIQERLGSRITTTATSRTTITTNTLQNLMKKDNYELSGTATIEPEKLEDDLYPTNIALKPEAELPQLNNSRLPDIEQKPRKRMYKNRTSGNKCALLTTSTNTTNNIVQKPIQDNNYSYNMGPGLNVSLDMSNNIVRIKLDGDNLMEIVSARWLNDDLSDEGRGKKYDMITRILPLFVLPFLIQSAIVPFLVTKLKLLLINSLLVGKLAIFLLIITAIRNSNKHTQTYEVATPHWAGEPSRRSEFVAAASPTAYNGYRVEGRPTAWIN